MGAYEYTALDNKGRKKKGVVEGDTPRQVRNQLREKGFSPLTVEAISQRNTKKSKNADGSRRPASRGGISSADLALITRQLATLVRSGLPLEESLHGVSQQCEKERIKSMMLGVRSRIMEGHTFAEGLADYPGIFNELFIATVSAGESSGHLDIVLERLAEYTELKQAMKQKIMMAMFYPIALLSVAVLVVIFLTTYVVPQVVQVFTDTGQALPLPTQILIATSDFLRENGIYIIIAIVAAIMMFNYSYRNENFKYRVHQFLLKVPFIRRLVRGANAGRFTRTFSILAGSGVPVLEAMRISSQVMTNLPMREAVVEASNRVREGANIHHALDQTKCFPPMTIHLIASGESSGKLQEMLERAAINQEQEIESIIGISMSAIEPIIIIVMGMSVLFIVVSILLPIFEMNNLVA